MNLTPGKLYRAPVDAVIWEDLGSNAIIGKVKAGDTFMFLDEYSLPREHGLVDDYFIKILFGDVIGHIFVLNYFMDHFVLIESL